MNHVVLQHGNRHSSWPPFYLFMLALWAGVFILNFQVELSWEKLVESSIYDNILWKKTPITEHPITEHQDLRGEKKTLKSSIAGSNGTNSAQYHFTAEESSVMEILDEYKRRHHARTLQREYEAWRTSPMKKDRAFSNRRFAKGTYSCPYQAGNRLFHFLNAFVYAVVTNRTLLWEYCTWEPFQACPMHGEVADCDKVLRRAAWIPSIHKKYTAWAGELDPPTRIFNQSHPERQDILRPLNEILLDEIDDQVVDWGIMERQELGALLAEPAAEGVLSQQAHRVAQRLFSAGTAFAYGACFHAAFSMDPMREAVSQHSVAHQSLTDQQPPGMASIAIHSRHPHRRDKGRDSALDELCLEQAFRAVQEVANAGPHGAAAPSCSVAIMADRAATLQGLSTKAQALGCDAVVAAHREGKSFSKEHGPFAGVGFFEDLAVAQYASGAVIKSFDSSSSDLLAALVAFRRTRAHSRAPLVICTMRRTDIPDCSCHSQQ